MLIWLNGPFGGGKTQTAYELHARLLGSFVFDPEEIGLTLRKLVPTSHQYADFQDIPLWRELTYLTLKRVADEFSGTIVVPMTVVVPAYHQEIVGNLREAKLNVHHFTLLASRKTVLKRLRSRSDGPQSWPARQLDRCLDALQAAEFAIHVNTEDLPVHRVAEDIASHVGLKLQPPAIAD